MSDVVILLGSIVVLTPNGQFLGCATISFNELYRYEMTPPQEPLSCQGRMPVNAKSESLTLLTRVTPSFEITNGENELHERKTRSTDGCMRSDILKNIQGKQDD